VLLTTTAPGSATLSPRPDDLSFYPVLLTVVVFVCPHLELHHGVSHRSCTGKHTVHPSPTPGTVSAGPLHVPSIVGRSGSPRGHRSVRDGVVVQDFDSPQNVLNSVYFPNLQPSPPHSPDSSCVSSPCLIVVCTAAMHPTNKLCRHFSIAL
jgi:hypothetical protein